MIISVGIDIIEIEEIKKSMEKSKRFPERVYTQKEISYCESKTNKYSSFAVRFAAKEAVMKALGTGWDKGVQWKQIEVVNGDRKKDEKVKGEQWTVNSGKPEIRLTGKALKLAKGMGVANIILSLSHSNHCAIANVIFEGNF